MCLKSGSFGELEGIARSKAEQDLVSYQEPYCVRWGLGLCEPRAGSTNRERLASDRSGFSRTELGAATLFVAICTVRLPGIEAAHDAVSYL